MLIVFIVKLLSEKLDEMGLTEFRDYAQDSGLYYTLLSQTDTNYTILVPSQEAFASKYSRNLLFRQCVLYIINMTLQSCTLYSKKYLPVHYFFQ